MRIKSNLSRLVLMLSLICPPYLQAASTQPAPLFDNLGSYNYPVSTSNTLAQRYFNQGLILFDGFEWGESIRSFQAAVNSDPNCGMCYWGLALALAYKGNAPMTGHEYSDGKAAIEKAMSLASHETPIEQAYIKALALRFQHTPKKSLPVGAFSCHTNNGETATPKETLAYSDAMKKVAEQFPQDNTAKALYAYSVFDLASWNFWNSDGKINKLTPNLIQTLQSILARDKLNVAGNHYYVHVIEQSPQPENASINADRLKTLVPGSEHLIHMPTHIYFLTGRYHEATEANLNAITTYQEYSKICHEQGFEPEITYLYTHDFDFLRTTAAMEGRKQLAMMAAQNLMTNLPAAWIEKDPELQWFIPVSSYVEARFGMWDKILKIPMPKTNYQYALGMWHYARGMAFAHTNDLENSKKEALGLQEIVQKGASEASLGKQGLSLLKIANEVLVATLANSNGDEKSTIAHLETAARLQHAMGYHEPPDWYFPVKEVLAGAYLKWGHPQEAISLYEQDLKQYPKNGWTLYGLAQALRKAGKNQEAERADRDFKNAWQYADIPAPIILF